MSDDEHDRWLAGVRERVRAVRLGLGLSYRAAGERTGVPFQTITRVETGKAVPTTEVLFKLAKGYGVAVEAILCGAAGGGRPPKGKK